MVLDSYLKLANRSKKNVEAGGKGERPHGFVESTILVDKPLNSLGCDVHCDIN